MHQFNSIDEYISRFPADVQLLLNNIRQTINKVAPQAEETIAYGIPTFKLNGNLVHFGGYKQHIGFYPGPEAIEVFYKELSEYKVSKGTVKFPISKELPYDLVARITEYRVKKNIKKKKYLFSYFN